MARTPARNPATPRPSLADLARRVAQLEEIVATLAEHVDALEDDDEPTHDLHGNAIPARAQVGRDDSL